MRFTTSMVVLALFAPASVFAQAVTRADLVGTWVQTATTPERALPNGTKEPATTSKAFMVFQDDGRLKTEGVEIQNGAEVVTWRDAYRWILAGDSLWQGFVKQTEADIKTAKGSAVQKVMISHDTLRLAFYLSVDHWAKAFPGKPYPWSEMTTYVRSTESVP